MANRMWLPHAGCLEVDVVTLFCKITIGASGAVSASSGKGIASVARSSAGKYLVTLSDQYNSLLGFSLGQLHSTDSDPATVGVHMRLDAEAVNNATPTVTVQCFAGDDGADADPASGAIIYVTLQLRNSSVS